MIASFFDGRVRIRAKALKDPAKLQMLHNLVQAQEGVLELAPNLITGSLLIHYDPEKISREQLVNAALTLQEQLGLNDADDTGKDGACSGKSGVSAGRMARRKESAALSVLYGLTVLGGFFDRRVHIVSGALFTALAAAHVYKRRNCL